MNRFVQRLALLCSLTTIVRAQPPAGDQSEAPPPPPPAATTASPTPASNPLVLKATDKDALLAAIGKNATVSGKIQRANAWDGGITFLNIEGGFTVVCFRKNYAHFPSPPDQLFPEGKTIEVTGTLKLHKEKPQIEITKPEQIRIVETAATEKPAENGPAPR